MPSLNKELDRLLIELAWSLWTELGVAGVERKHKKFLINVEELILLTTVISEIDPRLRDESLDWCAKYHHFISICRLKSILKNYENLLDTSFSIYSITVNSLCRTKWPIFQDSSPLKIVLSHKSHLNSLESPALLNIRARSIFGTGARADLLTFFLTHPKSNYSASDLVEIGYSKRNLAEILEELCLSKLLDKFMVRNQQRYFLTKHKELEGILGPIPDHIVPWRLILEILLPLRDCINRISDSAESTKVVEIRNFLMIQQDKLKKLNFSPPPSYNNDFQIYLNSFSEWLLIIMNKLAKGNFNSPSSPNRF